jgi:hypothetical protein
MYSLPGQDAQGLLGGIRAKKFVGLPRQKALEGVQDGMFVVD